MSAQPAPNPVVLQQHAEEAAVLRHVRSVLLRAPHVQLHRLRRLDDRIAAHLDGLLESGHEGMALLRAELASPTPGAVFALGVMALQQKDAATLSQLVSLAAALPEAERGWLSALGWVSAEDLQGTVRALLGSKVPRHRAWGLVACAMHQVDPGVMLGQAVQDADDQVRACAWRVAGQLGRRDLVDAARSALTPASAWALTLWGQGHHEAVRACLLTGQGEAALPQQDLHRLALLAMPLDAAREQVRALAPRAETDPVVRRRMMRMTAWVGDPQVVPWLIHFMADDRWARLAGECLSLISGVDLALQGLERDAQAPVPETGPGDDPEQDDVALDEDDSLPWPDQARVQAWWQAQSARFVTGQRYFMGEPIGPAQDAHLLQVLRQGAQRQRRIAAELRCLLAPGRVLFPLAAPAWRQARWLEALAAA
jgi:uncharacterized protein (TIGR02270 family)